MNKPRSERGFFFNREACMRNIKIIIEYDGTDFVGWQRQAEGRTVQEEIESVLQNVTEELITVVGAGRTDAGVHARGQVANFKTQSSIAASDLHRALNGLLPDDIVVHSAEEVDEKFSARYSARERHYRYFISRAASAIQRRFCWQLFYPLNLDLMNEAGRIILKTKDYQSFCKANSGVDNYLCNIQQAEWIQSSPSEMIFSVRANRYLHGMVRAIVGTIVDVGREFITLQDFEQIIEARDRRKAGMAAPPQGLFLEEVLF